MKTRNGYVSNSSSSSFVIAFKEPAKCECCGKNGFELIGSIPAILDQLGYAQKKGEKGNFTRSDFAYNGTAEGFIEYFQNNIEETEEGRKILEEKIEAAEETLKNKDAIEMASVLLKKLGKMGRREHWSSVRSMRFEKEYERDYGNEVQNEIDRMRTLLDETDDAVSKMKDMIDKLKNREDWQIITVGLDNMDSIFRNLFDKMVEDGDAVILDEVSS